MTLRIEGASLSYGSTQALDEVSLEVEAGELHLLAGPNGSGKTTLVDVVLDRVQPDSGSVTIEGSVGCGFQEPRVFEDVTVDDNLRLFGADDEAAEALRLDRVRERITGELSDGYRKKVDLAVAFAGNPDLIVLDEPLADLDDVSRRRLVDLVDAHVDGGGSALVATHRLEEFESADHLTVLLDGRVIASTSADEVATSDGSFNEAYLSTVEEEESRGR